MKKERKKSSAIWSIPDSLFICYFNDSDSVSKMLEKFGLLNKGGNYKTLKSRCSTLNLDYSKLKVNSYKNRKYIKKNVPLLDILVEDSKFSRYHLKKRLIKEGLLENKCSNCGILPFWDNKALVMVLDHINGISNDNRRENLRLLCPNCNSQTSTFSGKNIRQSGSVVVARKSLKFQVKERNLPALLRPDIDELRKLVWEIPTTTIALKYGVSDKAISKWCKKHCIEKPKRGYWQKQNSGRNKCCNHKRYKGIRKPKCLGGKGCQSCLNKYNNKTLIKLH